MDRPAETTVHWLGAVRGSVSEPDLLAVMRKYLSSLAAHELAQLPADCARRLDTRDDILECAVVLAREELKADGSGPNAALLRQMAAVFAEASTRLTRMVERGASADPRPG